MPKFISLKKKKANKITERASKRKCVKEITTHFNETVENIESSNMSVYYVLLKENVPNIFLGGNKMYIL